MNSLSAAIYDGGWPGTGIWKDSVIPAGSFRFYGSDTTVPNVGVSGAPLNWQNINATASVGCSDADSGCNLSSYGYIIYVADPVFCPATKASYTAGPSTTISNHAWVCAYAEDNAGNYNVSVPAEFKIDKVLPAVAVSHSPANPTTSDTVTITASATDDADLKNITIYVDGALKNTCTVSGLSGSCTYAAMHAAGPHSYNATVYDQTGNMNQSATSIFNVAASIISPNNGSLVALFDKNSIVIGLGSTEKVALRVKNSRDTSAEYNLYIGSQDTAFRNFIWFEGHKNDEHRVQQNITLAGHEEMLVLVNIFGGKTGNYVLLIGPDGSDANNIYGSASITVANTGNNGLFSSTPDVGFLWIVFAPVAASIILLTRKSR